MQTERVKRRCVICHATYAGGEAFCSLDGGAIVAVGSDDDLVGTTIDGRYLIVRLIGQGGMGKVYEAQHTGLGKRIALKFVSDSDANREQRARFRQEARAASQIVDEHVVQIFDVGVDAAGRDYLAMEYVDGTDLDTMLRDGPLPVARAIAIARQILAGLSIVHGKGIVHRDLKPSNIRIVGDTVKIMDFGIAKAMHGRVAQTDTGTGRAIGTPEFMAPEQIQDGDVDGRADLYAVGATLYAMLTGASPFGGSSSFTQRVAAMAAPIPSLATVRSDLPPSLVAAVARALEPAAGDRFSDAAEFAAALEDGAVIADARRDAATKPFRYAGASAVEPVARNRRWILLAIIIGLAIIGAAIYLRTQRTNVVPGVVPSADAGVRDAPRVNDAGIVASVPIDAALVDAVAAHPTKQQTKQQPLPDNRPACACEVKLPKGTISTACVQKRSEPSCTCEDTHHSMLCPFVKVVTDGKSRLPDGARNGTVYCVDRTRPECDPVDRSLPKSCNASTTVAVGDAACRGYATGQVEADPPTEGRYRCNVCDFSPTAPKFHGATGDTCTGFERSTGDKLTGTLACPKP